MKNLNCKYYRFEELYPVDVAHIIGKTLPTAYNKFWRGCTKINLEDLTAIKNALHYKSYDELIDEVKRCLAERRNEYGN